ncbi:MAG: radical SAM protein, partial [Desulfobacterales bacterium]|nr:radical SAM protein [Desulfobacterales bacterium]
MNPKTSKTPAYIQFYPTVGCNMSCSFCFNRSLPEIPDALPEDVEKIASTCRRLGIAHIDFLGGEPTLHPELASLVAVICQHGLRITLSSNGTRPEALWALSRQFPEKSLRIGISINSDTLPNGLDEYIRARRPIIKSVFTHPDRLPGPYRTYIGTPSP